MKKFMLTVFATFLVCILLASLVLFTAAGFSTLVAAAQKLSGGTLQIESVAGTLAQSFSVEKLRYTSKKIEIELQSMSLAWNPAKLFQGVLHCRSLAVDGLYVRREPEKERQPAPKGKMSLPDVHLPLKVEVEGAEITDIVFESGESARLEIDTIAIAVQAGRKKLELDKLTVTSRLVDLDVGGSVGLGGEWPVDISGQWRYGGGELPLLRGTYDISKSLTQGLLRVDIDQPAAAGLESEFSLTEGLHFEARLLAEDLDPSVFLDNVHGSVKVDIRAQGQVQEEGVDLAFRLERLGGELQSLPLEVSGKGRCSNGDCSLEAWKAVSGSSELRLEGIAGGRLDLDYELAVGSVGDFLKGVEGSARLQGKIQGDIAAPRISADIRSRSWSFGGYGAAAVDGDLRVNMQKEVEITADLVASDIETPGRQLDVLQVQVTGGFDQHRLEAELKDDELSSAITAVGGLDGGDWQGRIESFSLSSPRYGEMMLASAALLRADADGFRLQRSCFIQGEAALCLEAELQKDDWQAEMEMERFDPGIFLEGWSGNINALVRGSGRIDAATANVNLSRLDGSLNGFDLNGRARIAFDDGSWRIEQAELRSGDGVISAEGGIGREYAVDFRSKLPDISLLRSDLQGMLKVEGTLTGPRRMPRLQAFVEGGALGGTTFELEELEGSIVAAIRGEGSIDASVIARNLMVSGYRIDEVGAELDGTVADHLFSLNLKRPGQRLEIGGGGGYDDSWRGHLQKLTMTAVDGADFRLTGRPNIMVSGKGGSLEDLCLVSERADFCVSGRADGDGSWQALTRIDSFDLALLGDLGMADLPLDGELSAQLSAQGQTRRLENLAGWVAAPQIVLRGDTDYMFLENRLELFMEEQTLICTLQSNFEETGEVEGKLGLEGFGAVFDGGASLALTGRVDADFYDLGFITVLTNSYLQPRGHLRGSFDIGGSLDAPLIDGRVDLDEGEVYLPEQGITLEDVSASLRNDGRKMIYELSAASGPGRAHGEGKLSFGGNGGWQLQSHLTGSNFEVLATEEYVIRASPDLRLGLGDGRQFIEGRLDIPYARVTLEREQSRVSPSSDVVIVDEEQQLERKNGLVIDLDVGLGEDVRIDAYGLESSLRGAIELEDAPGRLLSATGELLVENAEFSFYSVELTVTRGRLLFSGGPIDNPGVDFRAVRRVDSRVVGVEVGGTAQDLQFQLFSDPAMSESDILAYMLVGRSMYASSGDDQSLIDAAASAVGIRGVNRITSGLQKYVPIDEIYLDGSTGTEDMSLVLGKYITEDLFVGYDHSFFDRAGEFKARYDLGHNFSVETRSSVNSTSGDILYSIEK